MVLFAAYTLLVWLVKLTGVLAAPRDVFSCCSHRSLMCDLHISRLASAVVVFWALWSVLEQQSVLLLKKCRLQSETFNTSGHLVVRLMEPCRALRNLEIFAHFCAVCRSIEHPEYPTRGDVWHLSWQCSVQPTPTFQAAPRVFIKIFARVVVNFKMRILFCSYYPSQEECLAPGVLEIHSSSNFSVLWQIFLVELAPLGKC